MEHEHSFSFILTDKNQQQFLIIANSETGKSTLVPLSSEEQKNSERVAGLVNVVASTTEKSACLLLQKDLEHPEMPLKTMAFLSEKELSKLIFVLQSILRTFHNSPDPLDPSSF